MASLAELKLDLSELESLRKASERNKVQEYLTTEIVRLSKEIKMLEPKPKVTDGDAVEKTQTTRGYQETISNYAWDQSSKFMKLYLSLDSLSSISDENISSTFTDKTVRVSIQFPNKTSVLNISKLCEEIEPQNSYVKKKSDYVLVMLKKASIGKTWAYVTEKQKEKNDKFKDKMASNDNSDPGASLQNMLKQMYDDGDDDMKRTIAKAFYDSQNKQKDESDPLAGL